MSESTSTIPPTMRASVLTAPGALSVDEVPTPPFASDEVLVKVAAVGVCGSDTHYYRHGRIGDFVVDGPLILGHECSGRSSRSAPRCPSRGSASGSRSSRSSRCRRCRECRAGRYNLCPNMEFYATPPIDGAFAEYAAIRTEFAHPMPDTISDEAAALLEPLSVAITTMRKAGIVPGCSVLIAGAGPIGIICAQTARAFGAAEIIVTDLVPERRERALSTARPASSTRAKSTSPRPDLTSTPSSTPAAPRRRSSSASRPSGLPARRCWSVWAPRR